MRLLSCAVTLVCLSLAVGASAQIIGIDDWGIARVEKSPTASWYGSTGQILTPSAYIAPPTKLSGGFHRIDRDTHNESVYNGNVGLTPDFEVGVARLRNVPAPGPLATGMIDENVFNAKYNLDMGTWLDLIGAPQVSVGVWDAADKLNRAIYVVVSQVFSLTDEGALSEFAIHLGFGDSERNMGALDGLFAAIEFTPFTGGLVQVEYDAEEFNADLRYFANEWITLDVGVVDSDFGWGVSATTAF